MTFSPAPAETAASPPASGTKPHYRFGFVLTTAAGNMTRYLNLRKYAERDADVETVWAPVSHYWDNGPYERLPEALRRRLVTRHQSRPVMGQLARLDAVMYHVFEPYALSVLRRVRAGKPHLVWSQDNPPPADPARLPQYGGNHARAGWRTAARLRFDQWCFRRTSLFVPFSQWAADVLADGCGVAREKIAPIHVGLDLELWPYCPLSEVAKGGGTRRAQILFVGGDFARKGGDLLLEVFARHFADRADLHLVTKTPPADLPPHVAAHTDLGPNDPRLRALYASADLFALPTRADVSSWVALEAMATGQPVIATNVGGIPDIVREGETGFLIAPDDGAALADRIGVLLDDAGLRRRMGAAGRAVVERDFSAAVSVPRILDAMKEVCDRR